MPLPWMNSLTAALGLRSDMHPMLLTPAFIVSELLNQVSARPCTVKVTVTLQHVEKLSWMVLKLHRIAQSKS